MSELNVNSASNYFGLDTNLLQAKNSNPIGKYGISYQEHQRRFESVNNSICSVELEGLHVGDEARAIYAQYVAGDLNGEELDSAVLGLHGIKP